MSKIDFNKIAADWFKEIGTIDASKNNPQHVDALRKILSEYIQDDDFLSFVMDAFVNPNTTDKSDYYDRYYDYGEEEIEHYVSPSMDFIEFNLNKK